MDSPRYRRKTHKQDNISCHEHRQHRNPEFLQHTSPPFRRLSLGKQLILIYVRTWSAQAKDMERMFLCQGRFITTFFVEIGGDSEPPDTVCNIKSPTFYDSVRFIIT